MISLRAAGIAAVTAEVRRLAAEIQQQAPRRYARGGPVLGLNPVMIGDRTPPTRAEITGIDIFDVAPAVPYDGPIRPLMSPYERIEMGTTSGRPSPFLKPERARGGYIPDQRSIERVRAESCAQTEPFFGATATEAAANLRINLGHCPHGLAEPVTLITGEVVAAVCPTCLEALPASFVGSDWKP